MRPRMETKKAQRAMGPKGTPMTALASENRSKVMFLSLNFILILVLVVGRAYEAPLFGFL